MDIITKLTNGLTEAGKSEGTAKAYVAHLIRLNGGATFKNMAYLKKTDVICEKIDGEHACKGKPYSKSSRVGMYCAIIACLELMGMKSYSKCLKLYKGKFNELTGLKEEKESDEKSKKQEENWVTQEEVMERQQELMKSALKLYKKKDLTAVERNVINQYFILSLYSLFPPRRNLDYLEMVIVDNESDCEDTSKNYLVIKDEMMIFNKYKTCKRYGTQKISYKDNDDLKQAVYLYLHTHPALDFKTTIHKPDGKLIVSKRQMKKLGNLGEGVDLLVNKEGVPFKNGNQITRTLNSIFAPKKVGSSLLRNVYITYNFGSVKDEMSEMAKVMAHSVSTQQEVYCKKEEKKIVQDNNDD